MTDRPVSLTFAEAAEVVLKASKRPMTAREIVDRALAMGIIKPTGKTPRATMTAALYGIPSEPETRGIKRLSEPGPTRARRGSVRWTWQP